MLLGDRLAVAVKSGSRVDTFVVDAESPAVALRAELEARRLPARSASLGVARSAVFVKQIELPAVSGDARTDLTITALWSITGRKAPWPP